MDATTMNSSVPQQTAAPQPVANPVAAQPTVVESTPQYVAPPQQAMPPQGTPNKTFDFFKDINWFEVTFMFLGALALIKTIDYYSYKKKEDKTTYYDIQRQIDKLNQRTSANESETLQIITMLEGSGGGSVQPAF